MARNHRTTVAELRDILATLPDDAIVVVECCQGGTNHAVEHGKVRLPAIGSLPATTYNLDPKVEKVRGLRKAVVINVEADYVG